MKHVHGIDSLKSAGHVLIELLFLINCSLLVRLSVSLRRSVVVGGDWRFNNLSGSHHQSQVNFCSQSEYTKSGSCKLIRQSSRNVIGKSVVFG